MAELTCPEQLVPAPQLTTTWLDSSTMSMYHTVGPTLRLAEAVSVTVAPGAAERALAVNPVRQVPSPAQPPPGAGVLVGGTGV